MISKILDVLLDAMTENPGWTWASILFSGLVVYYLKVVVGPIALHSKNNSKLTRLVK